MQEIWKNFKSSKFGYVCLYTTDLLLSGFFFTALSIVYYGATTDLLVLYIFPDEPYLNDLMTFVIAYVILFVFYVFQDELQSIHNWLSKDSTCFYGKAFLYRLVYHYIAALAYVAQWSCYWDLFDRLTGDDIHWAYSLIYSFVALVVFRVVLNLSFEYLSETVPFCCVIDKQSSFHEYFLQYEAVNLKNRKLSHFVNFIYMELIQMFLSLFAWYGISDLFMTGLPELLSYHDDPILIGYIVSFIIGYGIFFLLYFYEFALNKFKFNNCGLKVFFIKEIVYILSFISVNIVWHFWWDGYDQLIELLDPQTQEYVHWAVHLGCFFILIFLRLGSNLYGPRGIHVSFSEHIKTNTFLTVKEYIKEYSAIKFFEITYLSYSSTKEREFISNAATNKVTPNDTAPQVLRF